MEEISGIVFNIQKFSLHDGPGIRTVVFMKGCPLRCRWCANPESQSARMELLWDGGKCLGCGVCARLRFDGPAEAAMDCPGQALEVAGERKTVSQVVSVCLQDWDFYEESGGGVTLSGGEALAQPEFAAALTRKLKERGVHVAVETAGYCGADVFDRAVEDADLLLFDMKHWDARRHAEGTGVDNRLILNNMARAVRAGKKVLPRLPVIPGYNDSLEDAAGFVSRLREVGADKIQLLPFHQFGENKYALLGWDYAYRDVPALHEEDLSAFRQVFLERGIDAFF